MHTRIRMGITARLLLWCLALIAVFYATTAYLLSGIDEIVADSGEIVRTNHEVGVAVQRMLQQLAKLEENRKRYEILQDDAYMEAVVRDLAQLGDMLEQTLAQHPEYQDEFEPLTREYSITLKKGAAPERLLMPDRTVAGWMERLREVRDDNQRAMEQRLGDLNRTASMASRRGLMGLGLIIALGLTGSLLFAYGVNRSLRTIRAALREFGRTGRATSVDVRSRDELGELAQALDRLTARLEREERMRADFISMLSHEIRTPLTSIRESVDLVGDGSFGAVNEKQQRFLGLAAREAERLSALLERLMRVSRLEAGRMDVSPASLDPHTLALTALERVRPAAAAKDIRLEAPEPLPESAWSVRADAGQVEQVLVNLLGNAVKFSPRRGTVRLELRRNAEGVAFGVLDQGPGIPESERELVFQKWYRGEAGTVEGAGLGLYISQSIVLAHGGRMWVEGRDPESGCAFWFLLPHGNGGDGPDQGQSTATDGEHGE